MLGKFRLGTICYYVADIARTEAFYRDVLGFEVKRMDDDGEGNAWLTAQTANGIELIFFKRDARPGDTPVVVFDLPDGGIDDVVSGLAAKGVTIVTPVSEAPGGWSADVADPDGHLISMYQTNELPRRAAGS